MPTRSLILSALACCTLFSCKKENAQITAPLTNASTDISSISADDKPGKYIDAAKGVYKLVLQPGTDGEDAMIQWKVDDPANANSNADALPEIDGYAWTVYGATVKGRSLIKFTGLNDVPDSAKVIGAKLFLYGASSSVPLPQGNSAYPGSPYGDASNTCYVKRVTSAWEASTVTWNTQPTYTNNNLVVTPPSTTQWNFNTTADVTNLVKPMVRSAEENNGFLLQLVNESPYGSVIFSSSESTREHLRPKLVIVYKL